MNKISFKKLQDIVTNKEVHVFYDNDFWELRRYPMEMDLTVKQDAECIIITSKDVDYDTFPKHQLYDGDIYGNGLMILLANTPNHKVKSIRVA